MSETYKAIEVRKPGEFAEVRRPLQDPAHDQVRIRIEACGTGEARFRMVLTMER